MWSPLALLFFVGFALGAPVWQENKEYKFDVYARTLAGSPDLRDQYVGAVTKALLTLQVKSSNEIVGQLSDMEYGHYHDDIPEVWKTLIDDKKLTVEKSPLKGHTFVAHYHNGFIDSVDIDKTATNDEANQIKAFLSQLQVDITGENLIKSKPHFLPPGDRPVGLYSVMEPLVTGNCEITYQISDLPSIIWPALQPKWAPNTSLNTTDNLFSVKKELNFGNCMDRKGYHFGLVGDDDLNPNSNRVGGLLSDSASGLVIAMGTPKNFTIKFSTTSEEVFISTGVQNSQRSQVISQIQLALVEIGKINQDIPRPKNPVPAGNLVYRYNLPSDPKNTIRPDDNTAHHVGGGASNAGLDAIKIRRSRRSVSLPYKQKKQAQDSHDSGSSSDESHEHQGGHQRVQSNKKQPLPTLNDAPESPLLPFFVGYKGGMIDHSSNVDVEGSSIKLAQEIAEDVQHQSEIPHRNTLEKFSMLSSLVRTMNSQQIQSVASKVKSSMSGSGKTPKSARSRRRPGKEHDESNEEETLWQVFRDAVAHAGTGPAVKAVFDWVASEEVTGREAAHLITALQNNIRIPTNELLQEFFKFIQMDQVKKNRHVHSAAVISFTALLEAVEVDYDTAHNYYPTNSFQIHDKKNEELLLKQVVPYLTKELNQAVQNKSARDILLYIRAFGNLGHPAILEPLNTLMQADDKLSEFQRVAVVVALDKLVENFPQVAQTVIYKVYFNIAENPQVRCAAALQMMRTNPPASVVQHMATSTQTDPSQHVQSCTKSAIESAADLKLPQNSELARNAESARKYLNPYEYSKHYSRIHFKDYVMDNLQLSHNREFAYLSSPDSIYPNSVFLNAEDDLSGYKPLSIEFNAMISSIDQLLGFFQENLGMNEDESNRKVRDQSQWSSKWTRQYISDHLNIKPYVDDELEGQVFLRALGFQHFASYDKNSLKEIPQEILAALKAGGNFNYNKFHIGHPIEMGFPLATGYPLFFESSMPSIVQIQGKAKLQLSRKDKQSMPSVNVTAKGDAVVSGTQLAHVGFFIPSIVQEYVTGYSKKVQFHLPLNVEVNVSLKEQSLNGRVAFNEERKDVVIGYAGSYPFTARKSIDNLVPIANAKHLKLIKSREGKGFNACEGKDSTGNVFCLDAYYEWEYGDILELRKFLYEQDWNGLANWRSPIGQNDHYHIKFYHSNKQSTTTAMRFSIKLRRRFFGGPVSGNGGNSDDISLAESKHTSPDSEERHAELMKNAADGIENARAVVVDASVVFEGSNKAEYILTAARAASYASEKRRYLLFINAVPVKKENAKRICAAGILNVPRLPQLNFEEVLAANITSYGRLQMALGKSCLTASTRYNAQIVLDRTEEHKKEVQNGPTAEHCRQEMKHGHNLAPACVNATYQASFLDHAHVSVHFENPSNKFQNIMNWIHGHIVHKHFSHYQVDHNKKGEKNQVELDVNINSDIRTVNASLQLPEAHEEFLEIPYSQWIHGLFIIQPNLDISIEWGLKDEYTCNVHSDQVWTFDNATTNQKFGKCWYALSHFDESKSSRKSYHHSRLDHFSVLVRGESGAAQKDIMVVVPQTVGHDHVIRLSPAGGSVIAKAVINGAEHEVSDRQAIRKYDSDKNPTEDEPAFTVLGINNEVQVFIRAEKLRIFYNSENIRILADKSYFRDVRGLCGNYNAEKYDDKLSPRNCGFEDESLLAPSWAISDDECSADVQKQKKESEKAKCSKHYYVHSILLNPDEFDHLRSNNWERKRQADNSRSDSDLRSTPDSSSSSSEELQGEALGKLCNMKHQTQYIQSGDQICFSKMELQACPSHCKRVGKMQVPAPVHCLNSEDSLAKMYIQQIRKGASVELGAKPTTKTVNFAVPKGCMRQ